jgi:hypothetical protein
MTYTKKMHDGARRESAGKQNIVTDMLDEIDRLNMVVKSARWILEAAAKGEQVHLTAQQWLELHGEKKK